MKDRFCLNPPLTRPGSTRVNQALSNSTSDVGASMKLGLPWNVRDARPDARETAQEAARRAGLPVNEWVNTAILQRAAEQGVRSFPVRPRNDGPAEDYSRLLSRLDDLTRRFEQSARARTSAYAQERPQTDTFTDAIDRLEFRLREITERLPGSSPVESTPLPPNLERAVAEFTSRRRALNNDQFHDERDGAGQNPKNDPTISGLDAQLRRITEELEAFKSPAIENAIEAVRNELGVIGRTINEAMPRQAIESIEQQIQDLSQRVMDSRETGSDRDALGGIEQALADVRDVLRTLTPAESLRGYNDAIIELGRKVDLIVAEQDPATLNQLDEAIESLRNLSANIASAEAINSLSTQVRTLTEKVDHLALGNANGDVLSNLQDRIEILTRALSERTETETAVPTRLEKLMESLSDKIEQLQKSDGTNIATTQLEDRIVKLMSRLDASEARLGQLDAIERGLADLLIAIEDLRASGLATTLRAEIPASGSSKNEVVQVRDAIEPARAPGSLAAGAGAIDQAFFHEQSTQSEWPILRPSTPTSTTAEKTTSNDEAQLTAPPLTLDAALRATVASLTASMPTETQIWPSPASTPSIFSTDEPLEPGSGPPRVSVSPSNRIAASEAILVGVRPTAAAQSSKSNFIAAARRAAQAASHDAGGRARRSERTSAGVNTAPASHGKTIKSLFVAASVVAIIVGSVHYLGHVFDFGILDYKDNKVAMSSNSGTETSELAVPLADSNNEAEDNEQPTSAGAAAVPIAESDVTASLLAPPVLPSLSPLPAPGSPQTPPGSAPSLSNQPLPTPRLAPPALGSAPARPSSDVTGSVARAPAESKRQAEPAQQPAISDQLPAGIAGPQLRNAANAGDAGAAYEIALRYVEARGVPANLEEAARWFERAASKGLAPAQFRYASMLEKGQGVKKDLTAAQRLYIAAAAKGHAKAMHNLAVLYAEGVDGKPDYANAAQWFRKAAELGVADSQYNLGVLAARGLGTERNIAESYKWFALAAAQGDREAGRKRDEVAAHLDTQTLASAQQAVKDFTPMTQPAAAIAVPAPPGGWDRTSQKPRAATPLSISAFNSGKL